MKRNFTTLYLEQRLLIYLYYRRRLENKTGSGHFGRHKTCCLFSFFPMTFLVVMVVTPHYFGTMSSLPWTADPMREQETPVSEKAKELGIGTMSPHLSYLTTRSLRHGSCHSSIRSKREIYIYLNSSPI